MKVLDFLGQVRSSLRGHELDADIADDFEKAVWHLACEGEFLKFKTGVICPESEEGLLFGVGVAGGEAENQIAADLLRQWFLQYYPAMLSDDISRDKYIKDDVAPVVTVFLVRLNIAEDAVVQCFLDQVSEKIGEMLSTSEAKQESLRVQKMIGFRRSMIWQQGMAVQFFLQALTSVVKASSEKSWYTDQQMSVLANIAVEARGGFVPGSMFRVNNKEGRGLFVAPPVKDPCYFLGKERQPQPAGERDDRQSVLLEVLDWFDRDPINQQARVLYHLTYDNKHWVTVELRIDKLEKTADPELMAALAMSLGQVVSDDDCGAIDPLALALEGSSFEAKIYIHDPLTGCAEGRDCDRVSIAGVLSRYIPGIEISEYHSPYGDVLRVRQDPLDGQNCGPIGCYDFDCLINGKSLVKLSAIELAALRKTHKELQIEYSEALVSKDAELEQALRDSAAAGLEVEEVASDDDAGLQAALKMSLEGP